MKKNKNIISVCLVALLVVAILGVSYAYFSAIIEGSETVSTITMDAGEMKISFQNNDNELVFPTNTKIYPRGTESENPNDADAWIRKDFTIKGTNTTDLQMKYKLNLVVDNNTFLDNELSYFLTGTKSESDTTSLVVSASGKISTGTSTILLGTETPYFNNADGLDHNYSLRIFFFNKETDQNANQKAKFAAHVTVTSAD